MIHTKKINAGIHAQIVGKATDFFLLKCVVGTRAIFFNQGSEKMNTEVWQGMSLSGFNYDEVHIFSDQNQEVILWSGETPFDFSPQTERQKTIRAEQAFISNGIQKLLDYDPNRLTARIECDKDIWVGGENMGVVLGTPQNARKYKAGQEFEVTAYGDVNCFIANDAEAVLFEQASGSAGAVAVPWEYGRNRTRTELENLGAPYFDFEVPARMAGVPFKIKVQIEIDEGTTSQGLKLFITEGDPTTEPLTSTGFTSGGASAGIVEYEGNQHLQWPNGLPVGVHRVFMVDETTSAGYVKGQEVGARFLKVWTENDVFALAGTCQVMTERA